MTITLDVGITVEDNIEEYEDLIIYILGFKHDKSYISATLHKQLIFRCLTVLPSGDRKIIS